MPITFFLSPSLPFSLSLSPSFSPSLSHTHTTHTHTPITTIKNVFRYCQMYMGGEWQNHPGLEPLLTPMCAPCFLCPQATNRIPDCSSSELAGYTAPDEAFLSQGVSDTASGCHYLGQLPFVGLAQISTPVLVKPRYQQGR